MAQQIPASSNCYVQGTEQTADAAGQTPKGFGEAVAFSKNGNILAVGIPRAIVTINKILPTAGVS